ncbi:hypothetical protein VKT23_009091 [Stygiomarasmius scandens]|uniref:C2H2-type domain-containing protein n=1 Tax=Marasmiellus scandens TaxID=2682957 RepID=A0ABR1JIJ5_9AGAR
MSPIAYDSYRYRYAHDESSSYDYPNQTIHPSFIRPQSPRQFSTIPILDLQAHISQSTLDSSSSHGWNDSPNITSRSEHTSPSLQISPGPNPDAFLYPQAAAEWDTIQESAYYNEISNGAWDTSWDTSFRAHYIGQPLAPSLTNRNQATDNNSAFITGNTIGVTALSATRQVATDAVVQASRLRRKDPGRKGRFICPTCGRDFTANHNLKYHINSHRGKRPYECEHCEKRFGTTHVLKRHVSTKHTGKGSVDNTTSSGP